MKQVNHLVPGELIVPPKQYKLRRVIQVNTLEFANNQWVMHYKDKNTSLKYSCVQPILVKPEDVNKILFTELHELDLKTKYLCKFTSRCWYTHLTQLEIYWLRFDANLKIIAVKEMKGRYFSNCNDPSQRIPDSLQKLDRVLDALYQYASGAQDEIIYRLPPS